MPRPEQLEKSKTRSKRKDYYGPGRIGISFNAAVILPPSGTVMLSPSVSWSAMKSGFRKIFERAESQANSLYSPGAIPWMVKFPLSVANENVRFL
jgi:hypothetical protein